MTNAEPGCCNSKRYKDPNWERYCANKDEINYCKSLNDESADALKTVELKVVPKEKCLKITNFNPDYEICAIGSKKGEDACYGDSGGNEILANCSHKQSTYLVRKEHYSFVYFSYFFMFMYTYFYVFALFRSTDLYRCNK